MHDWEMLDIIESVKTLSDIAEMTSMTESEAQSKLNALISKNLCSTVRIQGKLTYEMTVAGRTYLRTRRPGAPAPKVETTKAELKVETPTQTPTATPAQAPECGSFACPNPANAPCLQSIVKATVGEIRAVIDASKAGLEAMPEGWRGPVSLVLSNAEKTMKHAEDVADDLCDSIWRLDVSRRMLAAAIPTSADVAELRSK